MTTNAGAQDIDVGSLWARVRRALPVLMIAVIVIGVATFAALSLVAKRYESEAQLTITAKPTNPFLTAKGDAGAAATVTPRLDPAAINTHVRALLAPDLLLKVGKSLNLGSRAEFNPAVGPVDALDRLLRMAGIGIPSPNQAVDNRVLAKMRKSLVVSSARESRFISVRFTSIDPNLAAEVANAIVTTYRNSLREIPVRETNDAVAALLPKIKQLSAEVLEAEAAAKRFRAETDQLTGGASALTFQQQRMSALNADLVKAEADISRSEARLTAAREVATRGSADTLPEVQNSRIIQDLMAQRVRVERQVNEARAVLLPAHPRMRQLNADLNGLRRSINQEIRTIVNSISKEVRLAQLRTERLRIQIADLKKITLSRSGDEAKLRSLDNTAKSKRNELQRLQQQLEDNRTVVDTNRVPVEATIVSMARPSSSAVFPKKGSYTLLAMASTLMLGLSLTIARGLLAIGGPVSHDRRASDKKTGAAAKPARQAAEQPVHSGEPEEDDGLLREVSASAPSTDELETSIPRLAQHFLDTAPVDGGFRLLIAGETDNIDPSDEAADLVAELSDAGARVLLLDWSLDGARLYREIDKGDTASLADLLAGRAEFEDILMALPDNNVHYIYAADQPISDELLDEDGLNLILDALDETYEHVIVVGRMPDAKALFETIQGRFDTGMTVAEASVGVAPVNPDTFLGFDVTDIEIIRYIRKVGQKAAAASERTPARRRTKSPQRT